MNRVVTKTDSEREVLFYILHARFQGIDQHQSSLTHHDAEVCTTSWGAGLRVLGTQERVEKGRELRKTETRDMD